MYYSLWWRQWGKAGPVTNPATSQAHNQGWVNSPQHPSHLWTIGTSEGDKPTDSKQQEIHDIGQQQDSKEELQWETIIDNAAEARGLKQDQWLMALDT